ncbi:hypothetical protein JRO89_XS01G0156900 [Xanthoceras sorbifolium]|uniref:Indole-3-acetic acid-amido synthetase GH3.6 n=1 Tax=Xanthoceras sorbifolium TaxID=99658 RepID=A0ABQ8IJZ7_9ROSI|nr:hypothetical protein JRO89_XS01G0156900 [Xanthoceras sorbifolium]
MPEAPKNLLDETDNHHHHNHGLVSEKNKKVLEFIEDVTSRADEVQERVLAEILSRSAKVEYLKRHGLDGRIDRETFKKVMPVVVYEELKSDIDRIANGDTSPILCSQPISEFLTRGEEIDAYNCRRAGEEIVALQSIDASDEPVCSRPYDPYTNYTSPNETILCPDSYQSMYSQLLCGLYQNSEVLRVGAVFASGFIRAIRFLEKHWPFLCNDIQNGTINPQIITNPSVREAVLKIIKPNPELAGFVETECRKGSWKGIITRLWPNTKYVDVIVTGTMSQYIPTLDFYSNGLPLVCTMYASSECYFGLNLNPLCKPNEVSYTLIPTMAYFEFLPVNRKNGLSNSISTGAKSLNEMQDDQQLVDLVDVKLGQEYELVVTTYAGLYRYRVGDILKVAGFRNKAPQFNFVCRKNVALSIDSDKTDEDELQNAVKNAANHLSPFDATLIEYTSYADTSNIPGHYVLFWEITLSGATPIPPSVFEDCCLTIEESLNSVYRQGRVSDKSIGPLEIKVVESGAFDKLMDYALNQGASINQYKTPRCVKYAPIIELLNSRVVSNYFSPKCPKWVPGHKQWSCVDN